MLLACIAVADPAVVELSGKLRDVGFDATASRIERGYEEKVIMLSLDTTERGEIIEALVECPEGLRDLRTVLQMEATRRDREDISQPTDTSEVVGVPLAHELEEALGELERDYHHGHISREEWADRRRAHLAWFAERGIVLASVDARD